MKSKYVIGVDYGTLSARAILVNVRDGSTLATAVMEYPHGVMDKTLPDGTPLPKDWALQHPQDYLDVLQTIISQVVSASGVSAEDIIAIGTDFTGSTTMPVDKAGTPLCLKPEYEQEPHAYVKLWKHHGAQAEADEMTRIAMERNEPWLAAYGGKIFSEWSLPRLWHVLKEAPHIYEAMDLWVEAGDWLVWQLTGQYSLNSCTAGYKSLYQKQTGYPSEDYFAACDEGLRHVIRDKCAFIRDEEGKAVEVPVLTVGSKAGELTEEWASKLGLNPGIAVSTSMVDGHVAIMSCGITAPGTMMGIIGTSACYMTLGETYTDVPGTCGAVEDGLIPGMYGYEAGQSCVGDMLGWLVDHMLPERYEMAAKEAGLSKHQYLTQLAAKVKPGESGLLALDWWNGNRSLLADSNLSGMILGMNLQTKPEEIYRSLMEAAAFGARMIVEHYRKHNIPVTEFKASGGISRKNPLMMQIYADVLQLPVKVMDTDQGGALGAAIMGATAAGAGFGGYDGLRSAIAAMAAGVEVTYEPNKQHQAVYDELYNEYCKLHDYFGRGGNNVMKRIR